MPVNNSCGIARIVRRIEETWSHVGMAIAVDSRHVLTCGHVINDALQRKIRLDPALPSQTDEFLVQFPYAQGKVITGHIVAWGLDKVEIKDVAVLELSEPMPVEVGLARFAPAQFDRKRWSCRGFNGKGQEREVQGEIGAQLSRHEIQLNGPTGQAPVVEPGYSGAPVWCDDAQCYFGMVVSKDSDHIETRVTYAIPTEVLLEVWPSLNVHQLVNSQDDALSNELAQVIDEGLVVLDRAELSKGLVKLRSSNSQRSVVVIRGKSKSGKSHCRYLFQQAARQNGAMLVYLDRSIVATVDEVIVNLFDALNAVDQIPPGVNNTAASFQLVLRKFKAIAAAKGATLWIAIDDLGLDMDGAPLIDPNVRAFFEQFVLMMKNPAFAAPFRLMLIHYPEGKLPSLWDKHILLQQTTSIEDIQLQHVIEVLKQLLRIQGLQATDAEIEQTAKDIMRKADEFVPDPAEPTSKLAVIHDEIINVSRNLQGTLK